MPKPIISVLVAAVVVGAVSSAHSIAVPTVTFPQGEQQSIRNLLLKAASPRVGATEPGKLRIPIPVDGVIYEVIVVRPGERIATDGIVDGAVLGAWHTVCNVTG